MRPTRLLVRHGRLTTPRRAGRRTMPISASPHTDDPPPSKESEERLCALYSRARLQALLGEMALVVLFLVGLSVTGQAHRLDEALDRYYPAGGSHVALDLFLILLGVRCALLPLHWF